VIFASLVSPNSNFSVTMNRYIDEDELRRFMIKEEVRMVYPLLAEPETGQITRKSLTDWLVRSSTYAYLKYCQDNERI